MKKFLVLVMVLVCSVAFAGEFELQSNLSQKQFKDLSRDLALIVTPTPNSPAEPLKTIGFDIAVETFVADFDNSADYWQNAWDDGDPDGMALGYRVHAQKGFPFGLDLGASVTKGGNIPFTAFTGEVKYAILKGTVATPALSVKGSYSYVTGLDDMDLQTASAGIYVSKGFLMLTPYAGLESVMYKASEDTNAVDLDDETGQAARGLVGLQFSPLPLISLNFEAAAGNVTTYGLKAGIRF